jgi:hypothetical protein
VQRQAVEERLTNNSPTHGVTQGQMWGLQPPLLHRTKPKLQRQKSRKSKKEETVAAKVEAEVESACVVPTLDVKSKKGKLRSKFKKSSLVTIAVSQVNKSETNKNITNPVKITNKASSAGAKHSSPSKRKNKKLSSRVQSTDF